MKICPSCAFSNEERFPTCVWCNTMIVNVKSTPSADPNHPEHAHAQLLRERRSRQGRQLVFATFFYAALITALAAYPGMIFDPTVLGEIFLTSAAVGFAVVRGVLGQSGAMFLQGVASTALILAFGGLNPFIAYTIIGHVVLPGVLYHWVDLIDHGHG